MNYEDWEESVKLIVYFIIVVFLAYHIADWIWR
jgi:hypothetical protein